MTAVYTARPFLFLPALCSALLFQLTYLIENEFPPGNHLETMLGYDPDRRTTNGRAGERGAPPFRAMYV